MMRFEVGPSPHEYEGLEFDDKTIEAALASEEGGAILGVSDPNAFVRGILAVRQGCLPSEITDAQLHRDWPKNGEIDWNP